MGDRTHVSLCASKEHYDFLVELMEPDHHEKYKHQAQLDFEEVNYGELPAEWLGELLDRGIYYTIYWASGDGYTSGEQTLRFDDDGNAHIIHIYDENKLLSPAPLLKIINSTQRDVIKYAEIAAHIKRHLKLTVPLPETQQETNSKIYLTRKLVGDAPKVFINGELQQDKST